MNRIVNASTETIPKRLSAKVNGRILKASLRWSWIWLKFCQLIANLFVILSQL